MHDVRATPRLILSGCGRIAEEYTSGTLRIARLRSGRHPVSNLVLGPSVRLSVEDGYRMAEMLFGSVVESSVAVSPTVTVRRRLTSKTRPL